MEIAPGIHSVKQLQGIFVHAFIVEEDDGLTLVDTLYSTDAKPIRKGIKSMGRSVQEIRRIVLTHAHRAHLGGLAALKAASGADVYCHPWEADIVRGERKQQCLAFRPTKPYILWPFQIASLFGHHPPCQVDRLIDDGDQVGSLDVVYAPGHTPGHLAFFHRDHRVLFAGDALVTFPEFGPGWQGYMLNHTQERETLYMMADLKPEVLAVGHGDAITEGGTEQMKSLIDRMERDGLY